MNKLILSLLCVCSFVQSLAVAMPSKESAEPNPLEIVEVALARAIGDEMLVRSWEACSKQVGTSQCYDDAKPILKAMFAMCGVSIPTKTQMDALYFKVSAVQSLKFRRYLFRNQVALSESTL
jgi:hypothetical protein